MTTIKGYSVSGVATCVVLPEFKIAFDIGHCPPEAIRCPWVFITHAHVDHMAGAVMHVHARALQGMSPSTFICMPEVAEVLRAVLAPWEALSAFPYQIVSLSAGETFPLKGLVVKAVATSHRDPSQGYVVYRQGKAVVSFTGDTMIEGVSEELTAAKTLILDCTYVGPKVKPEKAHDHGHTHLDEIVERAPSWACETIVLTHFSLRHRKEDIIVPPIPGKTVFALFGAKGDMVG